MNADKSNDFVLAEESSTNLTAFRSSTSCTRYFCNSCGTHVYIKYDDESSERWAGEIHFPTAILDVASLANLEEVILPLLLSFLSFYHHSVLAEQAMAATGKPRNLHVFASDRLPCLGDLKEWAAAPQYGGGTGLEPLDVPPVQSASDA